MVNVQVIGSQQEMLEMLCMGSSTLHWTKWKDLGETSLTTDIWKLMMCSKAVRQITWEYSGPRGVGETEGWGQASPQGEFKKYRLFLSGNFLLTFLDHVL